MPGRVYNARKNFGFRVLVDGVDQGLIQSFDLPVPTIDSVEHGDVNSDVGTPGKVNFTDAVLRKLLPVVNADRLFYTWQDQCANQITGAGLPVLYERVITLIEVGPDRTASLQTHIMSCWPKMVKRGDYNRQGDSANTIEEITLRVNNYEPV